MARSTKTTTAAAGKAASRAKPIAVAPTPAPPATAKANAAKAHVKATPIRKPVVAPAAAVPARIPPPSKGELRSRIEKLEAANAALKVKSRETNRAAKVAGSRIAELEAEVARLQKQASRPVAAPKAEKAIRRGRPPRSREIDPGDAVPPGVAVLDSELLDAKAEAARDALEEDLSGE